MESKLAKVHLLPTEDKTDIVINTYCFTEAHGNPLKYVPDLIKEGKEIETLEERGYEFQHQYFTTDETFKVGEWCHYNDEIKKASSKIVEAQGNITRIPWMKIVASSDPKLTKLISGGGEGNAGIWEMTPQVHQSFIKEYCEKGGIDEVLLEHYDVMYGKVPYDWYNYNDGIYKLKTDSNNCVIIHPVKTSWTKEEVDDLPIHIHEGIYNTKVYIKDGVIHVEPNKK